MFPVNGIDATLALRQTVTLATAFTVGVGFTVIVNVVGDPGQPLIVGVTVILAVTGVFPVFMVVNAGIFPEPPAAKPIDGVLLVQLYVAPATNPVKFIFTVLAPAHNV